MESRPKAVDLFAGAGGMSLGFEQAGFDIAVAVEIDPVHAATHHFNFFDTAALVRSVSDLDSRAILGAAGLSTGAVDVVIGAPPCQGFSLIGQRMLDDPRNLLVRHFLRIVEELRAPYFVFENVRGLTVGKHRRFLDSLIDEFDAGGYLVTDPWRVLNARWFGVPQCRERLFLLGTRKNLPSPVYPEPVAGDVGALFGSHPIFPVPTCFQALDDIPDIDQYEELLTADFVAVESWVPMSEYAREMHCQTPGAWHFGYRRLWDEKLLTSSMRTTHTDVSRRRFSETRQGEIEPVSRFYKLPSDGQANTLRAGTDSSRGAFTSPRPVHYRYHRCVSVREMARLHGYPEQVAALKIPDATPEIVVAFALSDEQALQAKVRYNRLIDVLCCEEKFPGLVCRAVSAQFVTSDLIALFELTLESEAVRIVDEKHYKLVLADQITKEDLKKYAIR